MLKELKTIAFFLVASFHLFAQGDSIPSDSIILKDSFYGYDYFYQGEKISGNDVLDILVDYPDIYDQFKSANEAFIFANVFCACGIALLATPIGMGIAGNNPNWSMAWAGAGIMLVSAPLFHKYNKNVPVAIGHFNSNPLFDNKVKAELFIGATKHGVGLSFNF